MRRFAAFEIGVTRFVVVALLGLFLTALVPAAGARSEAARAVAQSAHAAHVRPTRLVFAATVAQGPPQIFSLAPSGRAPAQLTFGAASASAPLPSPDGTHILFERGGAIWVMRPNGEGQRLLVAHGIQPVWKPDSRRIAYVSVNAQNDRLGIRIVWVDGRSGQTIVTGSDVSAPAWSPDGRSVAFARGGSLVVRRGGGARTVVARPGIAIERIVWSADGHLLAFDYDDPADGSGLEILRANGRDRRDLHGIQFRTASWSPTRPLLAYVEYGDDPLHPSFALQNPTTGRARKLAAAPWFINSLSWAPDGSALAFSAGAYLSEDLTATSALGVVTLAGRVRSLDHGLAYPLPESVAWTTSPAALVYRPPVPIGPVVSNDELEFREPVDEIAADGNRVAYRSCGTIGVWEPGAADVVQAQIDRPLCGESNIYFYNLALAGDQLAWGETRGGIQQFNSLVVEPVGAQGTRTIVAAHSQTAGDPRGNERTGYLLGSGQLLVFSTWSYCDEVLPVRCPGLPYGQATTIASETLWRVRDSSWPGVCLSEGPGTGQTSGHCQVLRLEPGPLRPLDADEGRIVVSGDNATLVLDRDGRQLLSLPLSTQAAELTGADLVVLVPGALRDYDATKGTLLHTWPLPDVASGGFCGVPAFLCGSPRLRLEDAAHGLVAYVLDGQIHLLRLGDGRDATVHEGTVARFGDSGLFYAYQASGVWPGRIRFVAFDQLPLR